MNKVPNGRQRRAAMKSNGFFKMKKNLTRKDRNKLREDNIKRGNEIFEKNLEVFEKSKAKQLEKIEERQIKNWKKQGYNDSEIEMLREANAIITVKDKDSWKTDKKHARQLMKDAHKLKMERLQND